MNEVKALVLGDYPYYRDDIKLWKTKLGQIKRLGVDVITCYIPWRHHYVCFKNFDFDGNNGVPNRNLKKFIQLALAANLKLIVRPGPFIHAEVDLGGIPDEFSPSFNEKIKPILNSNQEIAIRSEGKLLPNFFDEIFLSHASEWIKVVSTEILAKYSGPNNAIIGIQIGNEGIYSDSNWQENAADFSLNQKSQLYQTPYKFDSAFYDIFVKHFSDIIRSVTPDINILFAISSPAINQSLSTWYTRCRPKVWLKNRVQYAYSNWQGSSKKSIKAFKSLILAAKHLKGINIEENSGFSWDDLDDTTSHSIIFRALLNLACGAKAFSLYPVVATDVWSKNIEVNETYLKIHPEKKKYYLLPYGDQAPINAKGDPAKSFYEIREFINFINKNYEINDFVSITEFLITYNEEILGSDYFERILNKVIDALISVGSDFEIQLKHGMEKKHKFLLNLSNIKELSETEILDILEKRMNYLRGAAHYLFVKKNKKSKELILFVVNFSNNKEDFFGKICDLNIKLCLPRKSVLFLKIDMDNKTPTSFYLNTNENIKLDNFYFEINNKLIKLYNNIMGYTKNDRNGIRKRKK